MCCSDEQSGSLLSCVNLEARVRGDHPLRVIREIAKAALSDLLRASTALYTGLGRSSIAQIESLGLPLGPLQTRPDILDASGTRELNFSLTVSVSTVCPIKGRLVAPENRIVAQRNRRRARCWESLQKPQEFLQSRIFVCTPPICDITKTARTVAVSDLTINNAGQDVSGRRLANKGCAAIPANNTQNSFITCIDKLYARTVTRRRQLLDKNVLHFGAGVTSTYQKALTFEICPIKKFTDRQFVFFG